MADFSDYAITHFHIILKDGRTPIVYARKNGYINATKLCRAGGKEFTSWKKTDKYEECLETVKKCNNGMPSSEILINVTKGPLNQRGVYVHPDMIKVIAHWINKSFYSQVCKYVKQLNLEHTIRSIYCSARLETLIETKKLLVLSHKKLEENLNILCKTHIEINQNKDKMGKAKYLALMEILLSSTKLAYSYFKKNEVLKLTESLDLDRIYKIRYGYVEIAYKISYRYV